MGNKDFLYQYILDRLIPSITYHISVSAKPVKAAGEWYWSEPAHVTMTTDPDGKIYEVELKLKEICLSTLKAPFTLAADDWISFREK